MRSWRSGQYWRLVEFYRVIIEAGIGDTLARNRDRLQCDAVRPFMQIASRKIEFDCGVRIRRKESSHGVAHAVVQLRMQVEGAGAAIDRDAQGGYAGMLNKQRDAEAVSRGRLSCQRKLNRARGGRWVRMPCRESGRRIAIPILVRPVPAYDERYKLLRGAIGEFCGGAIEDS